MTILTLKWVFPFWEVKSVYLSVSFFISEHNFLFPTQTDVIDWNTPIVPLVSLTLFLVLDTNSMKGIKKLRQNYTVGFWKGYVIIQIIDNFPPKKTTFHSVSVDSASKPGKEPNFGPVQVKFCQTLTSLKSQASTFVFLGSCINVFKLCYYSLLMS